MVAILMNKENQERHSQLIDKLDKNRDYFAAEFKSINKRLDETAKKQDIDSIRSDMQTNMTEIREKLTALLKQG